jgi:hypothetical protein
MMFFLEREREREREKKEGNVPLLYPFFIPRCSLR